MVSRCCAPVAARGDQPAPLAKVQLAMIRVACAWLLPSCRVVAGVCALSAGRYSAALCVANSGWGDIFFVLVLSHALLPSGAILSSVTPAVTTILSRVMACCSQQNLKELDAKFWDVSNPNRCVCRACSLAGVFGCRSCFVGVHRLAVPPRPRDASHRASLMYNCHLLLLCL